MIKIETEQNMTKKLSRVKQEMISCDDADHAGVWPIECGDCVADVNRYLRLKLISQVTFDVWKKTGKFKN